MSESLNHPFNQLIQKHIHSGMKQVVEFMNESLNHPGTKHHYCGSNLNGFMQNPKEYFLITLGFNIGPKFIFQNVLFFFFFFFFTEKRNS